MGKHRAAGGSQPCMLELTPSYRQNFSRHFALIIIVESTVEVLLSTCQVSMSNLFVNKHIIMHFVMLNNRHRSLGLLCYLNIFAWNDVLRRISFIHYAILLATDCKCSTHVGLPSHIFSAPFNINGTTNIIYDPCTYTFI